MFSNIVSVMTLFMCCGQAAPSTRDRISVSVIIAAPSAMASPIFHIRMIWS